MKKIASILLCFLLFSCSQPKEEIKEPAVLKLVPSLFEEESWREHSIEVKLVCDLDAKTELQGTPWASIASSEVTGNGQTTIIIQLEANDGDEARKGTLSASCGSSKVSCEFVQGPLGSNLGIYHFEGSSSDVSFDELKHQSSVRRYADGSVVSRLLSPSEEKFAVFKYLPGNPSPGDEVRFVLYQNWLPAVSSQNEITAEVVKAEDGKLWLSYGDCVMIVRI